MLLSKDALEAIRGILYENLEFHTDADELINPIIKDLERLETFDYIVEQNVNLREKVNHLKNVKNRWKRNCKFLEKENEKLKQAIEILKRYVAITKRRNEVNGNYDIPCIISFGSYKDIIQKEYELLKEVLGNE